MIDPITDLAFPVQGTAFFVERLIIAVLVPDCFDFLEGSFLRHASVEIVAAFQPEKLAQRLHRRRRLRLQGFERRVEDVISPVVAAQFVAVTAFPGEEGTVLILAGQEKLLVMRQRTRVIVHLQRDEMVVVGIRVGAQKFQGRPL